MSPLATNGENPFRQHPNSTNTNATLRPNYAHRQYRVEHSHHITRPDNEHNNPASTSGQYHNHNQRIPSRIGGGGGHSNKYKPAGNEYEYDQQHIGGYISNGYYTTSTIASSNNGVDGLNPTDEPPPPLVIRGEEIGIVILVLLLWLAAIVLFFHRWGKIRMLEPYQPKFMETHRLSCPMADVTGLPYGPRSLSKYNLSSELAIGPQPHFAKCNYHGLMLGSSGGIGPFSGPSSIATGIIGSSTSRPRQNSVFVPHSVIVTGSSLKGASRRTKSAIDLSTAVMRDCLQNVRRNSKNSISQL